MAKDGNGKINLEDLSDKLRQLIDHSMAETIGITPIVGLEEIEDVQRALEALSARDLKQELDIQQLKIDVELLKVVIISGVNSGSYIEKFVNTDKVTILRGTYNSTRQRVEIDENAFIKAMGFSYSFGEETQETQTVIIKN